MPATTTKTKKTQSIPSLMSFFHMQKVSENKLPTTFLLLLYECQIEGQFASQSNNFLQ